MRNVLGLWILLIYGCDPVFAASGDAVRAHFQKAFAGQPTYRSYESGYASSKVILGYPGYQIHQNISHVAIAQREGRVFKNPELGDLPDGVYTYILTNAGDFELGRIENDIEIGVKHFQLANGRALYSAGEVSKFGGTIRLSIKSGTYSRYLLYEPGYSEPKTMRRMEKAFRKLWGIDVRMESETLYSDPEEVEISTLLKYCAHEEFARLHRDTICRGYVKPSLPAVACAAGALD